MRIDIAIESSELAEFEAWFAGRLEGQNKTSIAIEALKKLKKMDELGGFYLPDDIIELIDQYRSSVKIAPARIDTLKGALQNLLDED